MNVFKIQNYDLINCRGEFKFFHGKKASRSGAFEINEKAKIKIAVPRALAIKTAKIDIYADDLSDVVFSLSSSWEGVALGKDVYSFCIPIKKLGVGLYFGVFSLETIFGTVYGYLDRGALAFGYDKKINVQISVSDFKHDAPSDIYGGVMYHIFVDRFARGKKIPPSEGAILIDDWNSDIPEFPEYPGAPLKNNTFFGGSLYGIADKLDYLESLGVTVIYLSPIFESPSNHKYDTADYMTVDRMFGGERALKSLIEKARKKNIKIILDGVFNHTGSDSRYFNRYARFPELGAYQSNESEFYSWYDFKNHPNDYTSWWGIEILPRINPDNPKCRKFFLGDGGVIEKYAKMGIFGFRLDVVDELSDSFVSGVKSVLSENAPRSILYGEVWEDASNKIAYNKRKKYYLGEELDGVMNYPSRNSIISYLRNSETEGLLYLFNDIFNNAPKRIRDAQMNLIGTHDTVRIITALAGELPDGKSNAELKALRIPKEHYPRAISLVRLAMAFFMTIPGVPSIYYGDEAGLEGYSDPFNRRPFPWGHEYSELLDFVRKLSSVRRNNDVYRDGDFKLLFLSPKTLIFSRYNENRTLITAINNSSEPLEIKARHKMLALISGRISNEITIHPLGAEIIDMKSNDSFLL